MHEEYRELITLSAHGLLDSGEDSRLQEHLRACESCRAEREAIVALLGRFDESFRPVPDSMIWQLRQEWLNHRLGSRVPAPTWRDRVLAFVEVWLQPAFAMSAILLVLVGLGAGYLIAPSGLGTATADTLMASGFRIEGVSVEEGGVGEVPLWVSFKASKVFELGGDRDDPEIQRLLVHALIDNSNPGVRLRAVSAIGAAMPDRLTDPEVVSALIAALRTDENPAVRQQALTALRQLSPTRETRRALVDTLLYDSNARLRIEAIEALQEISQQGGLEESLADELSKGLAGAPNDLARRKARDFLQDVGYDKF